MFYIYNPMIISEIIEPLMGPEAHSIASQIADPGVMSLIPARCHTFMEIDCEIFSTIILLLPLI